MRIASKVAIGTGLLVVLFVAGLLYQLTLIGELVRSTHQLEAAHSRAGRLALETLRLAAEAEEAAEKFVVTADIGYGRQSDEKIAALGRNLDELAGMSLSSGEEEVRRELQALWSELPSLASVPPERIGPRASWAVANLRRIATAADRLLVASEQAIAEATQAAAKRGREAVRVALVMVVGAFLLSLLVIFLTVRSIREPLRRLIAGTRSLGRGDLEVRLDTTRRDEFAQLATDFNIMAERLGELDEVKENLLSHVSHELKTPLATIQETHRLLLEEVMGGLNAEQRELLELNLKSSERLSRLISKLLDLSRLEAGAVEYQFRPHDLGELAASAVAEIAPRSREAGLRVELERPAGQVLTPCDADRLLQVFENLLENALRFSPPDAAVVLRVARLAAAPASLPEHHRGGLTSTATGWTLISVADEGPGIPDGQEERIFERFHQAGPRRGGSVGGAGLGLAICREIVEAHRGRIWAERHPPRGALLQVLLPTSIDRQNVSGQS